MAVFTYVFIVLLFLEYAPEPTSLEAKFVGGAFVVVLAWAQLTVAPINQAQELRSAYGALPPLSIELVPTELGGYRAEGHKAVFHTPQGDSLQLGDESIIPLALEFPFNVYGQPVDSVYISSNGQVDFSRRSAKLTGSASIYRVDVPSVAALDHDLNPSEGGGVFAASTPDSFMVTWEDVPWFDDRLEPWPVEDRALNGQVILRSNGSIQLNPGKSAHNPVRWIMGISPGQKVLSARGTHPDSTDQPSLRGNLVPGLLPVSVGPGEILFREERSSDDFKIWATDLSLTILRNALIVSLLILILIPLFYRLSVKKRLTLLMDGLDGVNSGNLESDIPVINNDEVGQLSTQFNKMTESLRAYNHRMEDLVDERTADLRSTQEQLIQSEKLASLRSLTAGIAHEIKNPLNFVNNFAEGSEEMVGEAKEALASGNVAEASEIASNASQIAKHGKRADPIVKSMMQHARGGASEMETIQINDYLEEYINLAWHRMRARDASFEADVKRDFDDSVGSITAMPQELGRVILNLLNNAFDAVAETEKAIITVATRQLENAVEITVSDNGPRIPPEIREKIFEPFFTTKATGEGTGLGLSLSYDIVTKGHGGILSLTETEDGGAIFTMELPI